VTVDEQTIGLGINAAAWAALAFVIWWSFGDLRRDP
jgi:hypothetical protein